MGGERPTLVTKVARAEHGDNHFRGYWLNAELLGHHSMASIAGLAVGGPASSGEDRALLEDMAVAVNVADPRIWPLKVTRLVSAYGSMFAGLAAGNITMDRSLLSMEACCEIAARLVALAERADDLDDAGLAAYLADAWPERRPPGFGVPARKEDERVVGLVGRVRDVYRRQDRRYFRLFERVAEVSRVERNLKPNILLVFSAIALDLGFPPESIGALAWALVQASFQANAVEGAQTAPELMRQLPQEHLYYVGPPDRVSPRAARLRAGRSG
ncbi:MAG: hypothetical protein KC933_07440 [Myxococcales bacterium]|nr:hypothetical protein [Myxococcales bacterium]MCB9648590.1 hypothetical protein [Deltaproteobacteria bacterium]